MKKVILQSSLVLLFISLLLVCVQAQSALNKSYSWDDKTEEVTLSVNVEPGTKELALQFKGNVSTGNLVVTAMDPNGNGECGFCLITDCSLSCGKARDKVKKGKAKRKGVNSSCSSNTKNGVTKTTMSCSGTGYSFMSNNSQGDFGAKGNANEIISDPTPGKWIFIIEAIKVTGDLELSIEQG